MIYDIEHYKVIDAALLISIRPCFPLKKHIENSLI